MLTDILEEKILEPQPSFEDLLSCIHKDLSMYCMNTCCARCCYFDGTGVFRGVTLLPDEIMLVWGGTEESDMHPSIGRLKDYLAKKGVLNYDSDHGHFMHDIVCPQLDQRSSKCKIHNKQRPEACIDFPFYVKGPSRLEAHLLCEYVALNEYGLRQSFESCGASITFV